jgi:hypothetical protein
MSVVRIPVAGKAGQNTLVAVSESDHSTASWGSSDGRLRTRVLKVSTAFLLEGYDQRVNPNPASEHSTAAAVGGALQDDDAAFTYAVDGVTGYFEWDVDKKQWRWMLDIATGILVDNENGELRASFRSWILCKES